jgi:hypothetical protein
MAPSGSTVDITIWLVVEVNLGIVCACIPMFRPYFKTWSASLATMRLRGWISTSGRKPTGKSMFYQSKSTPPLPDTLGEEYDVNKSDQAVDDHSIVERVMRLGHMWELDDRNASS